MSSEILEHLHGALAAEIAAVNQYSAAAVLAEDSGYSKLAAEYAAEASGETTHVSTLAERIVFLGGTPDMNRSLDVHNDPHPVVQFQMNAAMEERAVIRYREAIAACQEAGDPGTRVLLEKILVDEEHHVDEARAELRNLEQIGEALWLAKWV